MGHILPPILGPEWLWWAWTTWHLFTFSEGDENAVCSVTEKVRERHADSKWSLPSKVHPLGSPLHGCVYCCLILNIHSRWSVPIFKSDFPPGEFCDQGCSIREFPLWLSGLQAWPVSMRMRVRSLALFSGLRISCCCELWCRSQTWLGSHVAMAVV